MLLDLGSKFLFFNAGSALLTAGYCLYSSSTIFVVTTRNGVYGFTLDPLLGEFILSHDNVKVSHQLVMLTLLAYSQSLL